MNRNETLKDTSNTSKLLDSFEEQQDRYLNLKGVINDRFVEKRRKVDRDYNNLKRVALEKIEGARREAVAASGAQALAFGSQILLLKKRLQELSLELVSPPVEQPDVRLAAPSIVLATHGH